MSVRPRSLEERHQDDGRPVVSPNYNDWRTAVGGELDQLALRNGLVRIVNKRGEPPWIESDTGLRYRLQQVFESSKKLTEVETVLLMNQYLILGALSCLLPSSFPLQPELEKGMQHIKILLKNSASE